MFIPTKTVTEAMEKSIDVLEAANLPSMSERERAAYLATFAVHALILLRASTDDAYMAEFLGDALNDLNEPIEPRITREN